jgi:hypothetical protein
VCVTCGRPFLPFDYAPRLFGCGCCAYAYKGDRGIQKGHQVVLISSGQLGVIESFSKIDGQTKGNLRMEGLDRILRVTPKDIERVFEIQVKHDPNCSHGKRFPKKEEKRNDHEGDDKNMEREGAEGRSSV